MKKIISILSLSLIVSFTSLYAEVDGYKDLKFSLNKNEARMILDKYCDTNIVNENFKDTKCNKLMGETTKITTSYNNKTGLLQVITLLRTPISPEDIKILVQLLKC